MNPKFVKRFNFKNRILKSYPEIKLGRDQFMWYLISIKDWLHLLYGAYLGDGVLHRWSSAAAEKHGAMLRMRTTVSQFAAHLWACQHLGPRRISRQYRCNRDRRAPLRIALDQQTLGASSCDLIYFTHILKHWCESMFIFIVYLLGTFILNLQRGLCQLVP